MSENYLLMWRKISRCSVTRSIRSEAFSVKVKKTDTQEEEIHHREELGFSYTGREKGRVFALYHSMNVLQFNDSTFEGYLGCFRVLASIRGEKADMNIHVQIFM